MSGSVSACETLVDLLRHRSQLDGEQLGYEFWQTGESVTDTLTYQELDTRAREIAVSLQHRNLTGERVLLFYLPGLDYVAAFFGCLYAGAIAVPAYPPRGVQKLKRLQSVIVNCSAKLVLTTSAIRTKFNGRLEESSMLAHIDWLATDLDLPPASDWQHPDVNDSTVAFLQYTSGSTGNPKGVMVSHRNLLHNLELIHRCFGHSRESKGVIWLPPYHDMGLIGGILQPMYGAFPVALIPPVYFLQKPLRWLKAVSRYRGTTSGGPNFAYQLCVEKAKQQDLDGLDLSSWDVAFNGAEPIRAETLKQFTQTFTPYGFDPKAFYPCYGMAESTLIITGGQKTSPAVIRHWNKSSLENGAADPINEIDPIGQTTSLVSSGHGQLNHQVLVVNPETYSPCRHRIVGEIWVAGTSVAQGYWNGPMKTEQTFGAYLSDGTTGPFLRTGDLGFLDEDGELFVVGRLKDVLIIRGQNHYPHDIETTVAQSHEALRPGHGAAISVDIKGTERLVVIHEVERTHLRTLNVSEVANAVRRTVTQQHQISPYAIVLIKTGSLPKTSSGKVKRYACREDFLANRLVVVDDWAETATARSKFQALQSEVDSILKTIPENSLPLTG